MTNTSDLQMKTAIEAFFKGDYKTGWHYFEARHDADWAKRNAWSRTPRDLSGFAVPNANSTGILVLSEGGAGDTVQFARFVPELAKRSQLPVVFEVQNPLVDLIKSFPGMENISVIPRTMANPADPAQKISPPVDARVNAAIPLLSLPMLMGYNDPNQMPAPSFPVQAPLPPTGPLKVGLCWRGDPNNTFDVGRDVPLQMLLPIINTKGVVATSLLDDMTETEKATAPNLNLPNPNGGRASFKDMADIIRQQDLIISSDTVWPNLAATLGKPVQMFTLKTPNWRWGLSSETTPWYPSMTLLRQSAHGDWSGPVAQALETVEALVAVRNKPAFIRPSQKGSSPTL